MKTRMFLGVVAIGAMGWASGCSCGEDTLPVCCHRGATYEWAGNLAACTSSGGTREGLEGQCTVVCCTVSGTSRMTSRGQCGEEGGTFTASCEDASTADGG